LHGIFVAYAKMLPSADMALTCNVTLSRSVMPKRRPFSPTGQIEATMMILLAGQ
jgi:hypothetical protein